MASEANSHQFLSYSEASIFFVYGFMWTKSGADNAGSEDKEEDQWTHVPLHERSVRSGPGAGIGAYQPTLLIDRQAHVKRSTKKIPCKILAPLSAEAILPNSNTGLINASQVAITNAVLEWDLRLLKSCAATITIQVTPELSHEEDVNESEHYTTIHWALHLAGAVDRYSSATQSNEAPRGTLEADSFLFFEDNNEFSSAGLYRLGAWASRVRDQLLTEVEGVSIQLDDDFMVKADELDDSASYRDMQWNDAQSPFVVSVLEVSEDSMDRVRSGKEDDRRELAAISCRLTLENHRVSSDFSHINDEYIRSLYSAGNTYAPNLCLDNRVYFSLSRRGAIAVVGKNFPGPAPFVVPSLINLCELLRAQLVGAISLGWKLENMARDLAKGQWRAEESLDEFIEMRKKLAAFQQNPVTHLFDGGSVTEVANLAFDLLWVRRAWQDVLTAFDVVDRLKSSVDLQEFLKSTS